MYEIFVVGSFWFWALCLAEVIALFLFVEYENGVGATFALIVFGICLQWLGSVNIIQFIVANPWWLVEGLAAYFALGIAWAVIKWYFFCRNLLDRYNELKADWLKAHNVDGNKVPNSIRSDWNRRVRDEFEDFKIPPIVSEHKARIMRWMSWWVFSLILTLTKDFMVQIWKEIYRRIATWLQGIADRIFADIKDDL
jgi:hypothetical protein